MPVVQMMRKGTAAVLKKSVKGVGIRFSIQLCLKTCACWYRRAVQSNYSVNVTDHPRDVISFVFLGF